MRLSHRAVAVGIGVLSIVLVAGTAVAAFDDWGLDVQTQTQNKSHPLFGLGQPLTQSSTADLSPAQALADPTGLITVAKGLNVSVVSSGKAAPNLDQMVLWPPSNPTHIIACNEEGTAKPALQKISLATGDANTIASGLNSCDPVRVTPWGTVLFGEETANTLPKSAMWEIFDPLNVTGATLNRTTGASSSSNVGRVNAFGYLAFEGLAILPNGVTYYGDELGPSNGNPGGAYYKFVPTTKWAGGSITSLSESPLKSGTDSAAGTVYGLKVGQGSNNGQGDAYGIGTWLSLTSASGQELRPLATANKLTGYYRPEDLTLDEGALSAGNVRFCGNNTGRDSARYWGETICITDGNLTQATANTAVPQVQLFVQGSSQLNMPDNIAYQPGHGNWIIEEDGSTDTFVDGARNDDIWDCLPDRADDDTLSDGCVRIASLNDNAPNGGAESTGGFFDPTGEHYYVSIQHTNDDPNGFGTILDITGWGSQGN
jgi:hypothetical protein